MKLLTGRVTERRSKDAVRVGCLGDEERLLVLALTETRSPGGGLALAAGPAAFTHTPTPGERHAVPADSATGAATDAANAASKQSAKKVVKDAAKREVEGAKEKAKSTVGGAIDAVGSGADTH